MKAHWLVADLLSLAYPEHCKVCKQHLTEAEQFLCLNCETTLALPNMRKGDEIAQFKSGLTGQQLNGIYTYAAFMKHGGAQYLLHQIKYHYNPDLGHYMGQLIGKGLLQINQDWSQFLFVPVPLHKDRLKSRRYNQAELLANGAAKLLGAKLSSDLLIRPTLSESLVKLNQVARLEQMKTAFVVNDLYLNQTDVIKQPIMLIDDILTTGATLGSCANVLRTAGFSDISIATFAVAD